MTLQIDCFACNNVVELLKHVIINIQIFEVVSMLQLTPYGCQVNTPLLNISTIILAVTGFHDRGSVYSDPSSYAFLTMHRCRNRLKGEGTMYIIACKTCAKSFDQAHVLFKTCPFFCVNEAV